MKLTFKRTETPEEIIIVDRSLPLRLLMFIIFGGVLLWTQNFKLAFGLLVGGLLLFLLVNFKAVKEIMTARLRKGYEVRGHTASFKNPVTIRIKK